MMTKSSDEEDIWHSKEDEERNNEAVWCQIQVINRMLDASYLYAYIINGDQESSKIKVAAKKIAMMQHDRDYL